MNDRSLYVGNFPYTTTDDDLRAVFSPYGEVVRVVIITDHGTGQSKGYGFIELDTAEGAIKAKEALDEQDFNGRPLRVNDATPRQPKPTPAAAGAAASHQAANHAGPASSVSNIPGVIYDDEETLERLETQVEAIDESIVSRGYTNKFYPELATT